MGFYSRYVTLSVQGQGLLQPENIAINGTLLVNQDAPIIDFYGKGFLKEITPYIDILDPNMQ